MMMKQCVRMGLAVAVVAAAVAGCNKDNVKLAKTAGGEASEDAGARSEPQMMDMEQPVAAPVDPEKVIARVGEAEIKQAEVNKVVDAQLAQYGAQVPENFQAQMRAQMQPRVVEMLIAQRVLRDEVARRKIVIDDADVTKRVDELSGSLPEGMTLDEALAQRGMDKEELLKNVREGMQFEKLIEGETASTLVKPTEADAQAFYDEKKSEFFSSPEKVQASHILITPEPKDDAGWAKAKEQIEALAKQLEEGADFAALAKEHSACPSKEKGGDLGEFGRGQMVPEFDEVAFTQEQDAVSAPVKTQFGYHLVKVTGKTVAGEVPFGEVKEKILESLENDAKTKSAEVFIDGLKAKANVVLVD